MESLSPETGTRIQIKHWQNLAVNNPTLARLVVDKAIVSYRRLDDQQGLREYLTNIATIPRDAEAFNTWLKAVADSFGAEEAEHRVIEQIEQDELSGAVANYLYQNAQKDRLSASQLKELLQHVLVRAKSSKIEYTCGGCGFDTKALHWLCPNCGEWESFS